MKRHALGKYVVHLCKEECLCVKTDVHFYWFLWPHLCFLSDPFRHVIKLLGLLSFSSSLLGKGNKTCLPQVLPKFSSLSIMGQNQIFLITRFLGLVNWNSEPSDPLPLTFLLPRVWIKILFGVKKKDFWILY